MNSDVLRPVVYCLNGRQYRKNPVKYSGDCSGPVSSEGKALDQLYSEDMIEDDGQQVCIVETTMGFRVNMSMPNSFHKFLIGKRGERKKQLEHQTRTVIQVPAKGSSGNVVITGCDRFGVLSAMRHVEMLEEDCRRRHEVTHFLSFPLNTASIMKHFELFRQEVMSKCGQARGLDPSIFQNPHKLHLTIGVLKLFSDQEEEKACRLLDECSKTLMKRYLEDQPATIQVHGVEYMNDDPSEVAVLYAKVSFTDGSSRLQSLVDWMVEQFTSARLMQQQHSSVQRETGDVKLHVTLMNTKFQKRQQSKEIESNGRQRLVFKESFDATQILQEFKEFCFGETQLKSIHLSERHSTSPDGYYTSRCHVLL